MSEGRKDDGGKLRMDLLTPEAIMGIAEVLTYGANKYTQFNEDGSIKVSGDRNWEAGIAWGRVYAALQRHLLVWWGGIEFDEESELHHLDHAACCLHFLQTYRHLRPEFDDRPSSTQTPIATFSRDLSETEKNEMKLSAKASTTHSITLEQAIKNIKNGPHGI